MVTLELDHVLCFVATDGAAEAEALEGAGLTLTPTGSHRGQGTSNRCVLFDEEYFEVLWLRDRAEAEGNPMRLERRCDGTQAPFGIALRGVIPEDERERFWVYRMPYAPEWHAGLWIHRSHFEAPQMPVVFVTEPMPGTPIATLDAMRPRAWKHREPSLRVHRAGATGIAGVAVHGTGHAWPLPPVDRVRFVPDGAPQMEVVLAGASLPPVDVGGRATIRGER